MVKSMMSFSRWVVVVLFACGEGVQSSRIQPQGRTTYAVKETHHVPRQWERVGQAPGEHQIRLQIGLKQGNFGELERHLYEVSDPSHPRYGQHLSQAEVHELIKPKEESLDFVHEWLQDNGIDQSQLKYSKAKDWVTINLPLSQVEHLLDTEYSIYQHSEDSTHIVRTPQYSLPRHLHEHIQTIQPTNSFFRPRPKVNALKTLPEGEAGAYLDFPAMTTGTNGKSTVQSACNESAITPLCLRTLYGTIDYTVKSQSKNKIALANYLGETNNRSDITIFLSRYRPDAVSSAQNFTIEVIANGDNTQTRENSTNLAAGKDLEGNLDAETILGITYPTPLTAYNTGGMPPFDPDQLTETNNNEPYLTWLEYILAQENIPQVISTSYGDDEQTVPYSFATAVCNSFAQLGARGVTVLFASGDNGVGSNKFCFTNDGKNTSTFLPSFPAGCPYVTTVGGTRNVAPEIAAFDSANNFASGGGFSNYFPRPSYQDENIPAYIFSLGDTFKGLYNTSGRGYPDIAAQGYHYITVWNGTVVPLDGTSASTPTASSIISLVNDALLAANKPVLGFMNPWLYQIGFKAFTDITNGSAKGCNTDGFPAQGGWDAVTGFGTPFFPKLQAAALNNGICMFCSKDMGYRSTFIAIGVGVILFL